MSADVSAYNEVSIVGGGITGLYAALRAVDNRQTNIHVYEASAKLGGKIKSHHLHDQIFNMGGEFIDSDDDLMITLCKRLGLRLVECEDQKAHAFQVGDGKIYGDFFSEYAPVAQHIIRDRKEMLAHPEGAFARHMDTLSLEEYVNELRAKPEFAKIPAAVFDIALNSFAAEVGQAAANVTAEQFIAETMRSTEKFLVSDCGYRVEGGTEAIITALHKHLEENGVTFHFSKRLESAIKQADGTIDLTFTSAQGEQHVCSSKVIMGLPTYALAKVHGLESFGLEPEVHDLLNEVQYASLIKFTVPVKPGQELANVNLFSPDVQSYQPVPGFMTFLCHNRDELSPPALVRHHLQLYARSLHKTVEEIFDTTPGHTAFENPDKLPCFSTPSPKNKLAVNRLLKQLLEPAIQGLAIAGTYFPLEGAIGFMECGLASVERAQEQLYAPKPPDHQVLSMRERIHSSHHAGSFGQRNMAINKNAEPVRRSL